MKYAFFLSFWAFFAFTVVLCRSAAAADPTPNDLANKSTGGDANRLGPWGLFDHRSSYGKGVFPEPFLVDDSDLEVNELRLDWQHQEAKGGQTSNVSVVEVEKGFGLLTLELALPFESDTSRTFDPVRGRTQSERTQGFGNVILGARHPVYQYVSDDEFVDSTFGLGLELALPTNSPVSKNTEIVPTFFNDLRIGEHFTLQTVLGYSFHRGGGEEGGLDVFEYGLVFGYAIPHHELPLPGIEQLIPMFELHGETLLNKGQSGADVLFGNIALRANLRAIGRTQPRLGIGYIFPIDQGARNELGWGIFTSLVFEF